jgi:hypothetical protein
MTRTSRDTVAVVLAVAVAVFVVASLVVVFALALMGIALPDVWSALFTLVVSVVSALAGWLVGKSEAAPSSSEHDSGG